MASLVADATGETTMVGMGQIALVHSPDRLSAVLGSCIGVSLYHPRLSLGVLGHVVLPHANGQSATPGKFADTAIPHMLQLMLSHGGAPSNLIAKIAGGACMFNATGPLQIGQSNIDAVTKLLAAVGVRLAAQDVGGNKGRRVVFDPSSGTLSVETAGGPGKIL